MIAQVFQFVNNFFYIYSKTFKKVSAWILCRSYRRRLEALAGAGGRCGIFRLWYCSNTFTTFDALRAFYGVQVEYTIVFYFLPRRKDGVKTSILSGYFGRIFRLSPQSCTGKGSHTVHRTPCISLRNAARSPASLTDNLQSSPASQAGHRFLPSFHNRRRHRTSRSCCR